MIFIFTKARNNNLLREREKKRDIPKAKTLPNSSWDFEKETQKTIVVSNCLLPLLSLSLILSLLKKITS